MGYSPGGRKESGMTEHTHEYVTAIEARILYFLETSVCNKSTTQYTPNREKVLK